MLRTEFEFFMRLSNMVVAMSSLAESHRRRAIINTKWSPGPNHQRQGAPGWWRWERFCHIGPLPGRYAQSRLSPGIYRHVCHRSHSGQLWRSPGDGDEVCDGRVTFKVQFQSAKFALWKINDFFSRSGLWVRIGFFCFYLRKIVSVRRKAFKKLKKYAIFCILELWAYKYQ